MFFEMVATGFFVGRLGFIPGTLGTLVAIPLVLLTAESKALLLLLLTLLIPLGVISANRIIEKRGDPDPEEVVVDEIVGFLSVFLFAEVNLGTIAVGFLLFRILDIFKPFPINRFEDIQGGYGVMLDDIVAGLITSVILSFLIYLKVL